MLDRRMQILVDDNLWQSAYTYAKIHGVSIGELLRNSLEEKLNFENKMDKRRAACEAILKIRPKRAKGRINYKALINYGRER